MQATSVREATVCKRPVTLKAATGIVLENREFAETSVYGSDASNVSSTTTRRQTWFIRDTEGREQSAELTNFPVQARGGNLLSIIWIIPKGKNWGAYCLAYNHDQKRVFSSGAGLKTSFPTGWAAILGWGIGITVVSFFLVGLFAPILGAVGAVVAAQKFSGVKPKDVENDLAVKAFIEELDRIDKTRIPAAV